MKILQINSVYNSGSTGRIVSDLGKVLEDLGHESFIAYGRNFKKNLLIENNIIKIGSNLSVLIHGISTRLFDRHGFSSRLATRKLIKHIRRIKPEIIHLHNIHGYYLNAPILFNFLEKYNIPVVWTLHDCWSYTGHCSYYDFVNCNKWKTGCNKCPEKTNYPKSILFDRSKKNFNDKKKLFTKLNKLVLVTPSNWLNNQLKESFLNSTNSKVINNGIDLSTFKPNKGDFIERYNLQNRYIILGVASIWNRRKGLKYFIDISDKIDINDVIVLVGLDDQQINQLPKNIIGIKKTTNLNELVNIYSSANIFINPTLEDNFPTTNIEALACGTPVITFNTGGSPESVNEKVGIVTNEKTSTSLLQAINMIKHNGISREACRSKALEYSKEFSFGRYIDLYLNLISEDYQT